MVSVTQPENVLVIDDSVDFRKLLVTFFNKAYPAAKIEEYDPVKGRPGESFPWANYDLLILDYDLGNGENGLDWLRMYKTASNFPVTIMLTAASKEELVVNALRFGAQGFLRKTGLKKSTLIESIKSAIEKYRSEKSEAASHKIKVHHYNREKFFESLAKLHKNDAVFLVEIDKFSELLEDLGVFALERFNSFFFKNISNIINACNYQAKVTRISDSSIALILETENSPDKPEILAKKICEQLETTKFTDDSKEFHFSVNIGIVPISNKKYKINELLGTLEQACREAREFTGNSYVIEGKETTHLAEKELSLSKEVNDAIENNQIQSLFQPLVLVSETPYKEYQELYQARFNIFDSEKNNYSNFIIIPILLKTRALPKLDRWIIEHSIGEQINFYQKNKRLPGMIIPVSMQTLDDNDLFDWLEKIIKNSNVPDLGKSLIFEINANDLININRIAKLQFNKIRVIFKSTFAISGIESPAMIDNCLSQEKFDLLFFSPEHGGKEKMNMESMQAIVNKARENKITTVANKIDTGEFLALAASAGADYVLGYFVHPPMEKIISSQ